MSSFSHSLHNFSHPDPPQEVVILSSLTRPGELRPAMNIVGAPSGMNFVGAPLMRRFLPHEWDASNLSLRIELVILSEALFSGAEGPASDQAGLRLRARGIRYLCRHGSRTYCTNRLLKGRTEFQALQAAGKLPSAAKIAGFVSGHDFSHATNAAKTSAGFTGCGKTQSYEGYGLQPVHKPSNICVGFSP